MINKWAAYNEGFGIRRGVVSCDTSQDFGSSPPVRALLMPPPAASCRHVGCKCRKHLHKI
ncbi:MAG: hypothetical protein FWD66_08800 [Paludibacter sp.]|nr:hypothetical protein [Paludibacter sp.]